MTDIHELPTVGGLSTSGSTSQFRFRNQISAETPFNVYIWRCSPQSLKAGGNHGHNRIKQPPRKRGPAGNPTNPRGQVKTQILRRTSRPPGCIMLEAGARHHNGNHRVNVWEIWSRRWTPLSTRGVHNWGGRTISRYRSRGEIISQKQPPADPRPFSSLWLELVRTLSGYHNPLNS